LHKYSSLFLLSYNIYNILNQPA